MALLATETILVILLLALGVDTAGSTTTATGTVAATGTALGTARQLLINSNIESVRLVRARRAEFGTF